MTRQDVTLEQLRASWLQIAGEGVGSVSRPAMFTRSGLLIVEADSPAWINRLEEFGPSLLVSLPTIDGRYVERVRFAYRPPETHLEQRQGR